jgi:hypothetical protein
MTVSNYISFGQVWYEELEEALNNLDEASFNKINYIYRNIKDLSDILHGPSFNSIFTKRDIHLIKHWIISSPSSVYFEDFSLFKDISRVKTRAYLIKNICQRMLETAPYSFNAPTQQALRRLADDSSYVKKAILNKEKSYQLVKK